MDDKSRKRKKAEFRMPWDPRFVDEIDSSYLAVGLPAFGFLVFVIWLYVNYFQS